MRDATRRCLVQHVAVAAPQGVAGAHTTPARPFAQDAETHSTAPHMGRTVAGRGSGPGTHTHGVQVAGRVLRPNERKQQDMAKTPAEIELDHFWRGTDRYEAYGFSDESGHEAARVFLDRNIVIPRPAVGEVTEERIPHTVGGMRQMIDGEFFSANNDPEYWRESIPGRWRHVENLVREAVKAEAVLAYLDAKQMAEAEVEITRDRRRDELVNELAPRSPGLGGNWYMNVSIGLRKAVDRIIELEGATK